MSEESSIQGMKVSEVVREVQTAIVNSGLDRPGDQGGLSLHTVTLKLVTVAEVTLGAKPSFKVPIVGWTIGGGAEVGEAQTHEIELKLATQWAPKALPQRELQAVAGIRNTLPQVVESVREMLDQANSGSVQLGLVDTTLTFAFQINENLQLELAVVQADKTNTATVTVVFGLGPGPSA